MIQFNQDLYKFPSEFLYGVESNVEEKEYMENKKKKNGRRNEKKVSIQVHGRKDVLFYDFLSVACLERGSSYRRSSIINSTWFIKKLLTLTRSTRRLIYVKSMTIRILFS